MGYAASNSLRYPTATMKNIARHPAANHSDWRRAKSQPRPMRPAPALNTQRTPHPAKNSAQPRRILSSSATSSLKTER